MLLNRIEAEAEAAGYLTVLVEAHERKPLPALLAAPLRQCLFALDRMANLSEKVKRGLRVMKSFLSAVKLKVDELEIVLDIDPEVGVADSGDLEADLPELFVALGEAAKDRGRGVAILIDELQYLSEDELSALIMAVHRISQKQLPVVLIGAGLPQLVALAGKSKSYAERLFDYPEIGPLSKPDAAAALQEPAQTEGATFTEEAIAAVVQVTEGYPYFLQEWGYHAWNIAPASPIGMDTVRQATERSIQRLDQSFFRVRFDRLTPREKEYLRALAEFGPGSHRSGDVAELLNVKVQSIAPVRNSLIRKGMIYSPAHGDTAFTVPLFDQFMKRVMPQWPSQVSS